MKFIWLFFVFLLSDYPLPAPIAKKLPVTYSYPKADFRYPLDLKPSTAGAFGEIRPNHFHSGLDFKTNQQEGYPVYAIADGYISRLRIQTGGFGNAVYIAHPNGFTSVYGHLQRFNTELLETIRDYQYSQETYTVDFALPEIQIPVKKGDIIAWSGNTGSSAGPHLHFEIRDSKTEETINPQLFGLEIQDHVKPTITSLYLYDLNGKPFSQETKKKAFALSNGAAEYNLANQEPISLPNGSGFGIVTSDKNSASGNINGPYSINLYLDDKLIYSSIWNRFFFDHSKAVNAHIDYPAYVASGKVIHKSFIEPGDPLGIYNRELGNGLISLSDDELHNLKYEVADIAGNKSVLAFNVRRSVSEYKPEDASFQDEKPIAGNISHFYYDKANELNLEDAKVIVKPGVLYSDINFRYFVSPAQKGYYSKVYSLHTRLMPIHDPFELWIKPDSSLNEEQRTKTVVTGTNGQVQTSNYEDGYVKASIKSFGSYFVKLDTVAP
ncbi:MAG: Peptidase, partial [Daejeonella sp.]|nr:Peptidase [Daejeonella sp.]